MKEVIGKGWSFPPHFNKYSGGVDIVSQTEEIEQSLAVLFSTKLGDRLFHPDFGCDLQDFQFKSVSIADELEMRRMIEYAVTQFEPRIAIRDLDVDLTGSQEGRLRISLRYTIKDAPDGLVHPFIYENNF